MSKATRPVDEREDEPQKVWKHRYETLLRAGYSDEVAWLFANEPDVDLHRACDLLREGATVKQALQILL